MRVLAGFFPASQGRARVAGYDVFEEPLEVKRRVGYLPENPPLYTEMTVDSYLSFVARIKGVPASDLGERLEYSKERCGLPNEGTRLIKHLSKGYRQRVGLAQALIHDPEVLILDEPTIGLDPNQISEVRELIRSLGGDHTIILSTHILPEVSMTCGRVIIINEGKIVAVDTHENLTRQLSGGQRIKLEVAGRVDQLSTLVMESRPLEASRKLTGGSESGSSPQRAPRSGTCLLERLLNPDSNSIKFTPREEPWKKCLRN
jgi:ABC-2 type transport system ATP-binding protein